LSGKIGIIGGSGIYNLEGINIIQEHIVETPYGKPSDAIIEAEIDNSTVFFVPRHGRKHNILPHEVNYRANIFALKKMGVSYIVSISAVGSLKEEYKPTDFVIVDQFIDWTKGKRERSFFGNGIVGHVSVADPVSKKLKSIIEESCNATKISHHVNASYICIEGPQFSSRAESQIYRSFGAGVIGMTNVPESYLAKEAAIEYATIAMVTDYDCWKEEHCTVDEIMKVMEVNNKNVQVLLKDLIPRLSKNRFEFKKENEFAVMTPESGLTKEQINILNILKS
jgi:5'-methylthioadenosine phosphorylase